MRSCHSDVRKTTTVSSRSSVDDQLYLFLQVRVAVCFSRSSTSNAIFVISLQYSDRDGSFTTLPREEKRHFNDITCPVCRLGEDIDVADHPQELDREDGFSYHGEKYHRYDFVLIRTTETVCEIGQIEDIRWAESVRDHDENKILIRALGRIGDIVGVEGCPDDVIKDEVSEVC